MLALAYQISVIHHLVGLVRLRIRKKNYRPLNMELIAINLARLVAFTELGSWDPFGKASALDAIQSLAKRFSFSVAPVSFEQLDFTVGVELSAGRLRDINIDKFTIFTNGIVIDTRSSTDDSVDVFTEVVAHAKESFGSKIQFHRHHFVSNIVFTSEMRLAKLHPTLQKIADKLAASASADMKHPFVFEPTAFLINLDPSQAKIAPSSFSIERRAEIPFSENTYFSAAPLETMKHIELVEEFEAALLEHFLIEE